MTVWFVWQMLVQCNAPSHAPNGVLLIDINSLVLRFPQREQMREMETCRSGAREETAGLRIKNLQQGVAEKSAAENKDDSLKPRSMLNNYRHATDPPSALVLGCSHTLVIRKEGRVVSPPLASP